MSETQPVETPAMTISDESRGKKRISKGEVLFDAFVYGPMNMIGTFILTIPVAWSVEHGAGRSVFEWAKRGLVQGAKIKDNIASNILTTTALMMGGNLMLIPVRGAEKHKENIVSGLNEMLGDKSDHAKVVSEPKQDWGSLIKSRALAWLMVFCAFFSIEKWVTKDKFGAIGNNFAHNVCDRFGWAKTEMAKVDGVMQERPTRMFGYAKTAVLDVFATIAAGVLLYVGSRFFAKKREEKIEFQEFRAAHPELLRHGGFASQGDSLTQDQAPQTALGTVRERQGLVDEKSLELQAAAQL